MLSISLPHTQGLFEKVLRAKDGRLYAVVFSVSELEGQVRAKIIRATLVDELEGTQDLSGMAPICLSCNSSSLEQEKQVDTYGAFVSPSVSELDFFVSQMTRAPSSHT